MTDPVIVGAGPAGGRAAAALVAAGLRPVVIDEAPASGGQIYRRQPPGFWRPGRALYGFEAGKAAALHATFDELHPKLDYRPETLVWDVRPGRLQTLCGDRLDGVPFRHLVLATGAMDRVLPLAGWTLPGVFSLGGAQIALKYQACAIGRRVAFLGTGPLVYLNAYQYAKAGVAVAAVLDTAPFGLRLRALPQQLNAVAMLAKGVYYTAWLAARRVPMHAGVTPLRIDGRDQVSGVLVRRADGTERAIACDAVAMGFGLKVEAQLADLAGVPFRYDADQRQWLPECDPTGRTPVEGVYLAGDGASIGGADMAELAGERAALALLEDLGRPVDPGRAAVLDRRMARWRSFRRGLDAAFPYPAQLAAGLADEVMVCRCEAVTAGALRTIVRSLGATEANRAKAFTRVGMGRCQGRVCGLVAAEILAAELGVAVEAVGRLRGQPPAKPLPMAAALEAAD
jgi:NADPH-dependent 2,4-dienoyl-CoA reductase/sulfur reductase-like enzyme